MILNGGSHGRKTKESKKNRGPGKKSKKEKGCGWAAERAGAAERTGAAETHILPAGNFFKKAYSVIKEKKTPLSQYFWAYDSGACGDCPRPVSYTHLRKPTAGFRCSQCLKPPEKPADKPQGTFASDTSIKVKEPQRAKAARPWAGQRAKTAFSQQAPDVSAIFRCRQKSVFPE